MLPAGGWPPAGLSLKLPSPQGRGFLEEYAQVSFVPRFFLAPRALEQPPLGSGFPVLPYRRSLWRATSAVLGVRRPAPEAQAFRFADGRFLNDATPTLLPGRRYFGCACSISATTSAWVPCRLSWLTDSSRSGCPLQPQWVELMGYILLAMWRNGTQLRHFAPPPYIPMPEGRGFTADSVKV